MKETVRTHIVIAKELVEAIDQLVGQRQRSQFVAEALTEKLRREQQAAALRGAAGILDPTDYPEWATPERTSAWVHASRADDDRRTEHKLRGLQNR